MSTDVVITSAQVVDICGGGNMRNRVTIGKLSKIYSTIMPTKIGRYTLSIVLSEAYTKIVIIEYRAD